MIVKVQLSLYGSDPVQRMLVYDKPQKIVFEADATREVKRAMKGAAKAFFHARMEGTFVVLGERAPDQDW